MNVSFPKNKKGFTLIETLVAISILMLSITGPMVFATQGLRAAVYSRDQVTAFYLAQDALETIRHLRDNTAIKLQNGEEVDWDENFAECVDSSVDCSVDSTLVSNSNYVIDVCPSDTGCRLYQHPTSFLYGYLSSDQSDVSEWVPTRYVRIVNFTKVNANEIRVKVTINWTSANIDRSFTAQENMFNIYGPAL